MSSYQCGTTEKCAPSSRSLCFASPSVVSCAGMPCTSFSVLCRGTQFLTYRHAIPFRSCSATHVSPLLSLQYYAIASSLASGSSVTKRNTRTRRTSKRTTYPTITTCTNMETHSAIHSDTTSKPTTITEHDRRVERNRQRTRVQRHFRLEADHAPTGDQPKAISSLVSKLRKGRQYQTLHGVTGSGKTFIMANIIAALNLPTLILAPNKTLAAQLCSEFSRYFPTNAVEFFVSHFKHYQPEAYLPNSGKYIAKSSSVDKHIDRLRHAATKSLFERSDTIVVASVSSIYGLGLPSDYLLASFPVQVGASFVNGVEGFTQELLSLSYISSTFEKVCVARGLFHANTDTVFISPPWLPEGTLYKLVFSNTIITHADCIEFPSGVATSLVPEVVIYPAKHFATPKDRLEVAISQIEHETKQNVANFVKEGRNLEASRLQERVAADIDMMRQVGFCTGMENYSMFLSGRSPGDPPETFLDYMPRDGKWLLFIDESHVTVPQLSAMHAGNAARKSKLIHHGFRLPSSMENRPLSHTEFWAKAAQTIFVSATPGPFELEKSGPTGVVEAVIRPTGVVDPTVKVVRSQGQLEHLTIELAKVAANGGKAIVTTITKKFAEDVAQCLATKPPVPGVLNRSLRVSYLHSGIDSVGRMQVLEAMRKGSDTISAEQTYFENLVAADPFDGEDAPLEHSSLDVIVGVNLLREGIDLPAVQLVAILDADSEGFLRGETALIQTIGRAARNVKGHVIMYADTVTGAMQRAITETDRRRKLQTAYNSLYNIRPGEVGCSEGGERNRDRWSVLNRIRKLSLLEGSALPRRSAKTKVLLSPRVANNTNIGDVTLLNIEDVDTLRNRMLDAAANQDFEMAALLRDRLMNLSGGKF